MKLTALTRKRWWTAQNAAPKQKQTNNKIKIKTTSSMFYAHMASIIPERPHDNIKSIALDIFIYFDGLHHNKLICCSDRDSHI